MDETFDKDKFERLLADKRHKQLADLLEKIADKLNKGESNKAITDAIEKEIEALGGVTDAIKQLPAPEVNVDLTELGKAANEILIQQKTVISTLKDLLSQKREWEFTIVRSYPSELIKTVIAKEINHEPKMISDGR